MYIFSSFQQFFSIGNNISLINYCDKGILFDIYDAINDVLYFDKSLKQNHLNLMASRFLSLANNLAQEQKSLRNDK